MPRRKSPLVSEKSKYEKLVRELRKEFPTAYIYKTNDRCARGLPDIIACIDGRFFAFEMKRDERAAEKAVTKLQQKQIDNIRDAGGFAAVVWDVEVFLPAFIKSLKEGEL